MKGDVSGCWLCLSDMFSLIPSHRVVPADLLSKQPPENPGEELHTAAESERGYRSHQQHRKPAVARNMQHTVKNMSVIKQFLDNFQALCIKKKASTVKHNKPSLNIDV